MRRRLPYVLPVLAFLLLWLLLARSISPGAILLGAALAVAGGAVLAWLRMPVGRLGRLRGVPGLLAAILAEVVRSNNAVARIILRPPPPGTRRAGFVAVPLRMRDPRGLSALACILTATPGTVWVDYDARSGVMLMHVLDMVDEETWVRTIQDRWERPLMAIFE